jgi:hypothetical protein
VDFKGHNQSVGYLSLAERSSSNSWGIQEAGDAKWEYLTLTAAYSGSDQLGNVKMYNDQELKIGNRRNGM